MRLSAFEILSGFVTAPSTTLTALTMGTGDSKVVRNGRGIWLIQAWVDAQATGQLQIVSPNLHDGVRGEIYNTFASEVYPLRPFGSLAGLVPNDTLSLNLSGSATSGDIESACLLIGYEEVGANKANLITYEEFLARSTGRHMVVENTLALGTAGGYSGSEAINAEYDQWKANKEYALIGYHTNVECAAVCWKGSDTANFRIGGPGNDSNKRLTGNWFLELAKQTGLNMIPVFSGVNKSGISIDGVQDENGSDPTVNSIFVELV